jgi:glycerophosphoryl diester phosphodiesterase
MTYLYPTTQVRVLAHRGLALDAQGKELDENTLDSFERAVQVGADYIESDIQVTADGQAVLFHDDDLKRVAGIDAPISSLSLSEVQAITLRHGAGIPTLKSALESFPNARFNLDFKVEGAIIPAAKVISELDVQERVLVASLSEARRAAAANLLPKSVSSAGSTRVLGAYFGVLFGLRSLSGWATKPIQVLQIPVGSGPIHFDNRRFIDAMKRTNTEVHFWTINEPEEMLRLAQLGASGVVTDRADLALATLR